MEDTQTLLYLALEAMREGDRDMAIRRLDSLSAALDCNDPFPSIFEDGDGLFVMPGKAYAQRKATP